MAEETKVKKEKVAEKLAAVPKVEVAEVPESEKDFVEETPKLEVEKAVLESVPTEEEIAKEAAKKPAPSLAGWNPKTSIGKKVKSGEIKDIDYILENGIKILEVEVVDALLPDIESDLLFIGQSKGKFGGGQKRLFRQTQKKSAEGNKATFETLAVVGNRNGYVGIGIGKSKETVPAREKAARNAKLSIFKIARGCGSWQCGCREPHTIPFKVFGKCGSVKIWLMPAPKGKGLCIEPECAKILRMAGIKDVWCKTIGHTASTVNFLKACVDALQQITKTKLNPRDRERVGFLEGKIKSD